MACRCAATAFPLLPSPATSSFVTTLARSPLTRSGKNGRGNYLNHTFKCGWNPQSHQPMKMCKSLKKHLPFLYLSYEQIRDQHYPYRLEVHLWNNGHSSLQHKLQHFHLKKKINFILVEEQKYLLNIGTPLQLSFSAQLIQSLFISSAIIFLLEIPTFEASIIFGAKQ